MQANFSIQHKSEYSKINILKDHPLTYVNTGSCYYPFVNIFPETLLQIFLQAVANYLK